MSTEDTIAYDDADVIGAIRLALVAAADPEIALRMIEALVEAASPTADSNTFATRLLVDTVQSNGWTIQAATAGQDQGRAER